MAGNFGREKTKHDQNRKSFHCLESGGLKMRTAVYSGRSWIEGEIIKLKFHRTKENTTRLRQ